MNKPFHKTIEFDDNKGILKCPYCGEMYLHQVEVVVEFRYSEDHDGTRATSTREKTVTEYNVKSAEINGRRDNIYITFSCEICNGVPKLQIQQHKGSTQLCGLNKDDGKVFLDT